MRHSKTIKFILWSVALIVLPVAYFIIVDEFPSGIFAIYFVGLVGLLIAYKRRRPEGEDKAELH